jgi:hypothetical protein
VEATLTTSEAKAVPSLQRRPNGLVTNVCVTGDGEMARKMRARILNETPIMLVRGRIFLVPAIAGFSGPQTSLANIRPFNSDVRPSMWICI